MYQAHLNLIKAMSPDNPFYQNLLKAVPNWKKDELMKVIQKLAHSDANYVYCDELIRR